MFASISSVKACMNSSPCAVIVDLDETIFNPLDKWRQHISSEMNLDFSVEDIERAGGLDNYFINHPRYNEFLEIVERLRADERLYHQLPLIEGTAKAISQIQRIHNLQICAYLTARPATTI